MPFMNKDLSKAIMGRTRFRNKFLKIEMMRTERSILNNATTVYLYLEKLKSNTMGI